MLLPLVLFFLFPAIALVGQPAAKTLLENRGQIRDASGATRHDILFTTPPGPVRAYLRRTGLSYVFVEPVDTSTLAPSDPLSIDPDERRLPADVRLRGHRLDMELVGANPAALVERRHQSDYRVNVYRGDESFEDLSAFGEITYREIYPRTDLIVRPHEGGLKYDLVLHPGADPSRIRLRYIGHERLEETAEGTVAITTSLGTLVEGRPVCFYHGDQRSAEETVVANYRVEGGEITFALQEYDRRRTLVIDPTLVWGTYFGGGHYDYGYGWGGSGWGGLSSGLAVDPNGNVTMSGGTQSIDFPVTPGAFQTTFSGGSALDAFMASFSAQGVLRWATYIGGNGWEYCDGIDADDRGDLYVGGLTYSTNFPTSPGAYRTTPYSPTPGGSTYDAWLGRFDSNGRRVWLTYFGTTGYESSGGVAAMRGDRGVVITGSTNSPLLPTTPGAFQPAIASGAYHDMYVARFDTAGGLVWCTYYGGSSQDWGGDVVADDAGRTYVVGQTYSVNFPVSAGAYQSTPGQSGAGAIYDLVVVVFDADGGRRWATYLGWSNSEWGGGIAVDELGGLYVGGSTNSSDLPTTPGALQAGRNGSTFDGFICKLDTAGRLNWLTYYGGTFWEVITGVYASPNGHCYVGGYTQSTDLLKTSNNYASAIAGLYDAFLVELDSGGVAIWDSYYGGGNYEQANGIVGDGNGSVYLAGFTNSYNLPTRNAHQRALNASGGAMFTYDAFLARFCDALQPIAAAAGPLTFCDGDSVRLEAPPGYDRYRWSNSDTTRVVTIRRSGTYNVFVEDTLGCNGTSQSIDVVVHALPRPRVDKSRETVLCQGDSVTFTAVWSGARSFLWNTGDTTASITVDTAGTYRVQVVDSNGCSALAPEEIVVVNPLPARPSLWPSDTIWLCADSTFRFEIDSGYYRNTWSDGATTLGVDVTSGRYWVDVYNRFGCTVRSDTVVVIRYPRQVPTITVKGPRVLCPEDSVLLEASPGFATYLWSTGETTRTIFGRGDRIYSVTATDTNGCVETSSDERLFAFAVAQPSIIPLGKTDFCEGDSVVLDGGTGQFASYRWNTGDTTSSIVVRASGRYRVAVTSFDGCSGGADSIQVTVHPRPSGTINGPVEVCRSTSADYRVSGGPSSARYEWSITGSGTINGSASGPTVRVDWGSSGTGRVSVRISDTKTNCATVATIDVVISDRIVPTITADRQRLCPGDSVELDAGAGYASYRWSTGATSRRIIGRAPNSYTVTVTGASGCSGTSAPFMLEETTPPQPVVTPLGATTLCAGDTVVLDAGAGWSTILWSDGSSDRLLRVTEAGSYSVTVSDTNGCTGVSAPIEVTVGEQPTPEIAGAEEVCLNSTASYSVAPLAGSSYDWRVTGGTIVGGAGTETIQVQWGAAGAGLVELTQTIDATGCRGEATPLAVVIGTQLRPRVTPQLAAFCPGDSVVLDAGAGFASYRWSTGETTRRLVVRQAGSYWVEVSDAGGCSGRSSDVPVREHPAPSVTITPAGPLTLQAGDTAELDAGAGYASYRWSDGRRTRRIRVASNGSYACEVTDTNGCRATSAAVTVVVEAGPVGPTTALLELPRVTAEPGERVLVPITVDGTVADTTVAKFRGTLRINRSLLLPSGSTRSGSVNGNDLLVPVTGGEGGAGTGELARLEFVALLGLRESTPLVLEGLSWGGDSVEATVVAGEFTLGGLCRAESVRLVDGSGELALRPVRPNPVRESAEVEVEVVEDGPTRLEVRDLLGRTRGLLLSGILRPGRYLVSFTTEGLEAGMYMLVLQTPSDRLTGGMTVVR